MKLTKLLLVLTAFTSLVVFSDTAARAAGTATANIAVTANVQNHCTIAKTDIGFGEYDPFSVADLPATGTVTVTCTKNAPGLHIDLDAGLNPSLPDNQMANGAERLKYGLFTNLLHTTRWNNSTLVVTPPGNKDPQTFTIYGLIVAGQDVGVGNYSDTVIATINY